MHVANVSLDVNVELGKTSNMRQEPLKPAVSSRSCAPWASYAVNFRNQSQIPVASTTASSSKIKHHLKSNKLHAWAMIRLVLAGGSAGCLPIWLAGWLNGCVASWLGGWLAGELAGCDSGPVSESPPKLAECRICDLIPDYGIMSQPLGIKSWKANVRVDLVQSLVFY